MAMKLALGTVQFGLPYGVNNYSGQVSRADVRSILQIASVNGVDTLDTAMAYGEAENCLGEVGVHKFKLVTKLPRLPDDCLDVDAWVQNQMDASLSRLGVNKVDGLLIHHAEQLLGTNGSSLYRALMKLKDKGQARKIGVSIYSPSDLDALLPHYYFDLVQAPFNLIDRRLYTSGWLQRLKDLGVEIHTRSVFLQGLLLMNRSDIPSKFLAWNDLWRLWQQWLEDHSGTAIEACLAYPLSFSDIDRVIVGVDSPSQLAQIIDALRVPLNRELPDLQCDDEFLINPGNWNQL
jgi:aryl-alcohol dehydrogenase-like predicted oxidoreductase